MSALAEVAAYQAQPAEQQNPEDLRKVISRAAAAAGAAAPVAVGVPAIGSRQMAAAAVVGALVSFMERKRALDQEQLVVALTAQAKLHGEPLPSIQPLLDLEAERAKQFAANQEARVRQALPAILAMGEGQPRAEAMKALMVREERYERQRAQAMFGRAVGGLNAVTLEQSSPNGAWWKLSPFVKEHTAGCLAMGERFWPWAILRAVHPPRHPGCPCHLESYSTAVGAGWMTPDGIPSLGEAKSLAAGVVMEATLEERLELGLVLVERGLIDADVVLV